MSNSELNAIKKLTGLATSSDDTWIRNDLNAFHDMTGNLLPAILDGAAIKVAQFVADVTPPLLWSFSFNMLSGSPPASILLQFSETVNASSFLPQSITIQNSISSPTRSYTLSSSSSFTHVVDDTIRVTLTTVDLQAIKDLSNIGHAGALGSGLARGLSTTFISLSAGSVYDMAGNPAVAISSSRSLQAVAYTADITPPIISAFSLDMNLGILSLTFSKTVQTTSFNITAVALQNNPVTPTIGYTLAATTTFTLNGVVLTITIGSNDLNSIKSNWPLASSLQTTSISASQNFVEDLASNFGVERR